MIREEIPAERQTYQLPGGPIGCLILHGFMGSPASSRPLGDYLNGRGFTVHAPLLPGHGHLPARLRAVSHRDWLETAERALRTLRQSCPSVIVIGHSMGAVAGAYLAARHADLRGFVMLAPLYTVPRRILHAMPVLRHVMPWLYPLRMNLVPREVVEQRVLDFDPTLDLRDPQVLAWLDEGTKIPTDALDEMRKMARLARKLWARLNLPTLILQGDHDEALDPEHAHQIFKALPHPEKRLHWLPGAGHELMRLFDPAHEKVWEEVLQFCLTHGRG